MPTLAFATFLIVCPTSFFLGIVFSLFPYDYPLLWGSSGPPTQAHLQQTEAHLRLLHASPALIVRILHTMIFLGLAGLVTKLYRPSESNMLFDGGSLVLYMCGIIVYVANIVKGLRIVTEGSYGSADHHDDHHDHALGDPPAYGAVPAPAGHPADIVVGREDNLKVLSASNTILALVLVGVLVLQAGQWYAERADEREKAKLSQDADRDREQNDDASASIARRSSLREAKKGR